MLAAEDPAVSFASFYHQGLDLSHLAKSQAAFRLSHEPGRSAKVMDGTDFGQALLWSARLVEVGVQGPSIRRLGSSRKKKNLQRNSRALSLRTLDPGLAALVNDLEFAWTLENTLVMAMGEFGRTPKSTMRRGEIMASAICRSSWLGRKSGGQSLGATEVKGYYAAENVHTPGGFRRM